MKIYNSATRIALLTLVITACALALLQLPVSDQFQSVITTVVAFFFGTKVGKVNEI